MPQHSDVTIPQDVAKQIAERLRGINGNRPTSTDREIADLLDPPSPSLRNQVAKAIYPDYKDPRLPHQIHLADTVLAVVANWLAAQPLVSVSIGGYATLIDQRNHDVRLIRGEAS